MKPAPPYDSYDGLIFDCDGTLVDSMPAHFEAWTQIVQQYGLSFPEDQFYALGGVPAVDIVRLLAKEQGKTIDADAVGEEKEKVFFEGYLHRALPIDEVVSIAKQFHGLKPMAVATGGIRKIVTRMLTEQNLISMFDTIVTCEDVKQPKPAPDTYALAAEKLGLNPQRCIAFEDTDTGLQSAKAAGMDTVDIRQLRS